MVGNGAVIQFVPSPSKRVRVGPEVVHEVALDVLGNRFDVVFGRTECVEDGSERLLGQGGPLFFDGYGLPVVGYFTDEVLGFLGLGRKREVELVVEAE